jgi:hypothetical protein
MKTQLQEYVITLEEEFDVHCQCARVLVYIDPVTQRHPTKWDQVSIGPYMVSHRH